MKLFWVLLLSLACIPLSADYIAAQQAYKAKRYQEARELFLEYAQLGEHRSQYNLGIIYYFGQSVEKDLVEAYGWIRLANQHSDASDNMKSALATLEAELGNNLKKAQARYRALAKNLTPKALAKSLYPVVTTSSASGQEVAVVEQEAPDSPTDGKETGFVRLNFDVDALGKPRNIRIIEYYPSVEYANEVLDVFDEWQFERFLDQEGQPTYRSDLVHTVAIAGQDSESFAESRRFQELTKRAKQGLPSAEYELGHILNMNASVSYEQSAIRWLLQAGIKGNRNAQLALGRNLLFGVGCQPDAIKAAKWLSVAAQGGESEALELLALAALRTQQKDSQLLVLSLAKDKQIAAHAALNIAWIMTTSQHTDVFNPQAALDMIDDIDETDLLDSVTLYEIQAAAFAALGNFEEAVDWQEDALFEAESESLSTTQVQLRLSKYREGQTAFR